MDNMNDKLLYQPVSPFTLIQKFGENMACVSLDGTNKVIACDGHNPPPGYKSVYGAKGHTGIDLRAYHGQEVYCAQGGKVIQIDTNPKSGLDVRVQSFVGGRELIHIYEHLLGYQPKLGDELQTGDLIGWADNTGWSSGDHLHFEVLERIGDKLVKIDPLPLMAPVFARDVKNVLSQLKELVAMLSDRLAFYLRSK